MNRDPFTAVPKFRYWRSEKYLRWVASQPCCGCGIEGRSQAAHSNQAKHGKGRSIKASDEFTFPLCTTFGGRMGCHEAHDLCWDMTRDERDELEDEYIKRTQARAPEHLKGWM